ncbi:hypothetical protein LR002_00765, partial [Candidatus Gracilibacteria bacterium]|nr:hypothetical protein [Candidatus Gracilibacteria bacterium]
IEEEVGEKLEKKLEGKKIENITDNLGDEKIVKTDELIIKDNNKNLFSDLFDDKKNDNREDDGGKGDIFSGVLKKNKTISISATQEEIEEEGKKQKKKFTIDDFGVILKHLNLHLVTVLFLILSIIFSSVLFFYIVFDSKNYIFSYFGGHTLGSKIEDIKNKVKEKEQILKKIELSVKKMVGDIPQKIYLNTPQFISLEKKLKEQLLQFYNPKTGMLKAGLTSEEKGQIAILFNKYPELNALKTIFVKQDVLNTIINNRIYWKSVYKDLIDATNNVFAYNEVIHYVKYDNFSVNEKGEITVSGKVTDPSGKVFAQLFRLEKALNDSPHFSGVSINNFNKTINPDKNVGGMVTNISLRFNYYK